MKTKLLCSMLILACVFSTQLTAQNSSPNLNDHFQQLIENSELLAQDVNYQITSQHTSKVSGVHHIYFRQVANGFEVYGTDSSIHILPNGKTLTSNNNFINNAARRVSDVPPALNAPGALQAAASQLNYNISSGVSILKNKSNKEYMLSDGGISRSSIPAKLVYFKDSNNQLVLTWDISIEEVSRENWWSVRVDAANGAIVDRVNWMLSCGIEHDHSNDHAEIFDYNANLYDIPNYKELATEDTAGCSECYEVFALPLESPYYGNRTILTLPANTTASPFGWHDTNGAVGAEFTVTQGNNVNAEDANTGYQPDGGSSLEFTGYPFDQIYTNSNQYEDASITNLFYLNNALHDIVYAYGLDEAAGNFQENNYGNGGSGSDSVNAGAQISVWCNATFGTPPDGQNPSMNMYICNDKDGDFDNLVVFHEYGHGVSNRLTGGGANTSCLGNSEQMGEGWSDFIGAVLTIEPGDVGTDARGVGTYLFGQGPNADGIRSFPYSTDTGVNPFTYDDIKTESVPHGVGAVWATMLWDLTWALVDTYGYDTDIFNFSGDLALDKGNVQALALVMEGMKLQPCQPGFVDGRDAIFAADVALYGGANECLIWDVFAARGLGVSASQGSSGSRSDGTEAFDTPSGVADLTAFGDVCESSPILIGLSGGTPFGGVYSGPGVTDDGNGSTYSFDPFVAGVGFHTITYTTQAGACSTASSDTDTVEVIDVPDGPITTGVSGFCPGDSVTVTSTLGDPGNIIRWFDAPNGGNFLFEGTSYTFNPTTSTTVYAQEQAPGPLSQLVISEVTLETPDRFEIQNVGIATDYTGYAVAVSEEPYNNINIVNPDVAVLGNMAANSVVDFRDDTGQPGYWGSNIFWGSGQTGWIVIIDDAGNVVDSVFWGFSTGDIASFNVTINGFNITAADLDWTGPGASLSQDCSGESFHRIGDNDDASDWQDVCLPASYGAPNDDIALDGGDCLAARTPTAVDAETEAPVITCPADETVTVPNGTMFTIPDYTGLASATDNCTASPTITQSPAAGTQVGAGDTIVTMTATDEALNEDSCTFIVTVIEDVLGVNDTEFNANVVLYPNPTSGNLILVNNSTSRLVNATIMDVNGRIIQQIDLSAAAIETNFSIAKLAAGMYFVNITAEDASIVKQIIKN